MRTNAVAGSTVPLFEVFFQRYERGSTVVTSNLPFEDWTAVLGSQRLAGALLDRLTHHVSILSRNGDSYRLKASRSRRSRAGEPEQSRAAAGHHDPGTSEILPASASRSTTNDEGTDRAPASFGLSTARGLVLLRHGGLELVRPLRDRSSGD